MLLVGLQPTWKTGEMEKIFPSEDRREHLAGKWKVFFGSLQWKRRTLQETMDAFREKSVHCNLQSLSGIQDPFVP